MILSVFETCGRALGGMFVRHPADCLPASKTPRAVRPSTDLIYGSAKGWLVPYVVFFSMMHGQPLRAHPFDGIDATRQQFMLSHR